VNNPLTHLAAILQELCPICGERLGKWRWFVGGPGSAFHEHGWFIDLPGHVECIEFSLAACPYLASPNYLRHLDHLPHADRMPPEVIAFMDETVDPNRPPLFVMVAGERIELQDNGPTLPYVRPTRPYMGIRYWRHGKRLTDAEGVAMARGVMGADWSPPL